jgi:hypothetical protein
MLQKRLGTTRNVIVQPSTYAVLVVALRLNVSLRSSPLPQQPAGMPLETRCFSRAPSLLGA